MADEFIATVGRFSGWRGWTVADRACRTPGQLISGIPIKPLALLSHTDTEDMSVGVRHGGTETGVWNGILAVNVAGAEPESILKKARCAELIEKTRTPVEGQRDGATRALF